MSRFSAACLLAVSYAVGMPASSEPQPFIVSETVQIFARENNLGERLGIDWSTASSDDIARYIHYLTAIDIIAAERAKANGQERPTNNDYRVAAWSVCSFPLPFKPPDVDERRSAVLGSYVSEEKQLAIQAAIGPVLLNERFEDIANILTPHVTIDDYQNLILNFEAIE